MSWAEDLHRNQDATKLSIIGVASVLGGAALAGGAGGFSTSWDDAVALAHSEPFPTQMLMFATSIGGVVLGGVAFKQMLGEGIKQFGRETVLTACGALILGGLAVTLARELATDGRPTVSR